MPKKVVALAALFTSLALAGCSPGDPIDDPFAHYAKRITTVDATAGNDQAANIALQSIDPWPRYVHDTHIKSDAARLSEAFENYQTTPGFLKVDGKSSPNIATSGQAISVGQSAGASPSK